MNDIIHMARAVDPVTALLLDRKAPQGMDHETFVWFLERFAALVRADEREQCAKVCDDAAIKLFCGKSRVNQIDRHTAEVLRGKAATIRARKES